VSDSKITVRVNEKLPGPKDSLRVTGHGVVRVIAPDGTVKAESVFENLITDVGDAYYAAMAAAGVSPAAPSAPTLVTGMKLGTDNTAAAKNTSGSALGAYVTGSNATFDAGSPAVTSLGAGLGVEVGYSATWAAGTATADGICEIVIVDDAATDAISTSAHTISRAVFTALDKSIYDGLVITWYHKFLGA